MEKTALLSVHHQSAITLLKNLKLHLKITSRSNVLNNSFNSNNSLQNSLQKSLKATHISITASAILAVLNIVIAGVISFVLMQDSKDTDAELKVLLIVNLGIGFYNVYFLPKLFARQANIKDKLLYLELREVL